MWATITGVVLPIVEALLSWWAKVRGSSQAASVANQQAVQLGTDSEALHVTGQIEQNQQKAAEAAQVVDAGAAVDPGSVRSGADGFSRD